MQSVLREQASHQHLGIAAAGIAVAAWGLAGVIAKDIDMGGVAIGAYRFTIYGLVVAAVMSIRRTPLSRRVLRASLAGGLALGLDVAFFFSAIKETTVANATVISALQPVLVSVIAARVFGERIQRRDVALAAVALAGVVVVVLGARGIDEWSLRGDLLAVGALFAWSAYFVFSKLAKDVITANEYTVGAALWCGLFNIPIALAVGQSLAWPSAESWVGLLLLAFGAGLLGHMLMNWSIQQIPLWLGSTFTLLIPVVSAAAAWAFLGEPLTATQIVAIAIVLLALAAVIRNQAAGGRLRPLRR